MERVHFSRNAEKNLTDRINKLAISAISSYFTREHVFALVLPAAGIDRFNQNESRRLRRKIRTHDDRHAAHDRVRRTERDRLAKTKFELCD